MDDTRVDVKVCQRCSQSLVMALHEQLTDPESDTVQEALTRPCDGCGAPKGVLCHNHIQPGADLPGRLIHFGRRLKP